MKKQLFSFVQTRTIAFLLFALSGMGGLSAQVTVSNMKADYPAKQISFTVTWETPIYNDQIWVIVDYIKIAGVSISGSWSRALVTGATATTTGSVTAATVSGNRGFLLNASGRSGSSGSANVTATLSLAAGVDKFNWCAHAFDFPPNATPIIGGGYDLHGTPPFTINGTPLALSSTTYGAAITSITDLSDNPNGIVAKQTEPVSSCALPSYPYAGSFADFPATYSASTAVSLMDERDRKIYNAVKIDDRWWMAQNLNYQQGLVYFDQYSEAYTFTGSDPALRGCFWCPTNSDDPVPKYACDYWGAVYAWETAMMLDGRGTWTEVSGSYCTVPVSTANCKLNYGRSTSSGADIGGRGICPPNWHVPTAFEWNTMFDYIEGNDKNTHVEFTGNQIWYGSSAAQKLHSTCIGIPALTEPMNEWSSADDMLGFRLLGAWVDPARSSRARWHLGCASLLCTSSVTSPDSWHTLHTRLDYPNIYLNYNVKRGYFSSVRCIRD